MAAEAISDIANALAQIFDTKLERQWNRICEAASRIPVVDGVGKNAAWDAQFSSATGASVVAEGSDVAGGEFAFDPNIPATLAWANIRAAFQISDGEVDAAASGMGNPEALVDIFSERVMGAMAKVALLINAGLFTGTGISGGNPDLVGFFGGSMDATGTYAGINRSTYAEWAGYALGNGGTPRPLTEDLLYQVEESIYVAGGEKPDLILASPGVIRKYAGLFSAEKRVVTDGSPSPMYASGTTNLFWNGMPVIRDRNCPAGKLAMLNTQHVEIKVLQNKQTRDVQSLRAALPSSNGATAQPLSLIGRVTPLARTGSATKMMVNILLALCVKHPNKQGQLLDIAES